MKALSGRHRGRPLRFFTFHSSLKSLKKACTEVQAHFYILVSSVSAALVALEISSGSSSGSFGNGVFGHKTFNLMFSLEKMIKVFGNVEVDKRYFKKVRTKMTEPKSEQK